MRYEDFIARKKRRAELYGFEPTVVNINPFDWQNRIVTWMVRRGRAALFADTGLGKTLMQLLWCENVVANYGPVLLCCPLGVRQQTLREAKKFGIGCDVRVVESQEDCGPGINITNYDRLDKFHAGYFAGVDLDESGVLKSMTGKIRNQLISMFASARFRLACTATPSPNDHMELGNHAEFLGVMDSSDMLNRFFYHDSGNTAKWVIRPHGKEDFWKWVASWAVCIGMPSDIGGDDTGYILPEMRMHRHFVSVDGAHAPEGMLFNTLGCSATTIHEEKRMTCDVRVKKAARLANSWDEPVIIWCDTNQESQALVDAIDGAVEIAGSHKTSYKEQVLEDFASGKINKLVTKPSICGMGLNWQHCRKMVFAGLTYSFESYYQAIRRIYRFGQTHEVDIHIVLAETDSAINSVIARKESDFAAMRSGMAEAMRSSTWEQFGLDNGKRAYFAGKPVSIPNFIGSQHASH
jgi:superfamily II DNA or RNA helicase